MTDGNAGPRKPRGAEGFYAEKGLLHLSGTSYGKLTETETTWLSLGKYRGTQHLPGSSLWSTAGMKEKVFTTD